MGKFAFGADGTSMGQHDVFGDGESQASAAGFARTGFIDAIEALEETREVLGGNAGAEILYAEFDRMRNHAGTEDDASAGGSVFQGIVDQVREDLVDGFAVGQNVGQTFRDGQVGNAKIDTVRPSDFPEAFFCVMKKFGRRDGLNIEARFSRIRRGPG